MKEIDIATSVVQWLKDEHWEVYQEVCYVSGGNRADIVAVQGPVIWVIETKTSCSLSLLMQAVKWKRDANKVSIAVPSRSNTYAAKYFLDKVGIGILVVKNRAVAEVSMPTLQRKISSLLRNRLCDEHKTFAPAGNSENAYWTPYQQTCREIRQAVSEHPGIALKVLVSRINHHYSGCSSAKSSISFWVRHGKIKGIECRREGKYLVFYPSPDAAPKAEYYD